MEETTFKNKEELEFQFPSNGKAYPKRSAIRPVRCKTVSIPFKRESVSKVRMLLLWWNRLKFQFPSNGKAYPKIEITVVNPDGTVVSIPFKRESVSKVLSCWRAGAHGQCFNSLQTGKRIQSGHLLEPVPLKKLKFQFPSNGKAYPKSILKVLSDEELVFQFPSNGKAYPKYHKVFQFMRKPRKCFNSLQTGKRIQSCG